MPITEKRFTRKLSGEEALDRYIMVLKDDLAFFPKPGVPFKLKIAGKYHESQIKAVDCWCRGPKKPHVHYRIDLAPFAPNFLPHFGQKVVIEKVKAGYFQLL
jgi:hypothetical protein